MQDMDYKVHTERNNMGKWRMAGNNLIKCEFLNYYSDFSEENIEEKLKVGAGRPIERLLL